MGYYTKYHLEIENEYDLDPYIPVKVAQELNEMYFQYGVNLDEMLNPLDIVSWESQKWYNHKDNMCLVSSHYPECKFILEGQGEDPEDMWREYYYNGHMQIAPARIEYDEPRWEELKNE